MNRIADLLRDAAHRGLDRVDAQLLLSHLLQRPRSWLIAHDDDLLEATLVARYDALVQRRLQGEPVAYLTGEKEFHGLRLEVSAAVLVPRPDTETLVDWALELTPHLPSPAQAVDLGTGSGAIALAVKHRAASLQMTAVDTSTDALDTARHNARQLGLDLTFVHSHWWQALAGQRFHLALSNPPYIAEGDPHLDALQHEPQLALTSGVDGLDALRAIIASAPDHLHPGGWLLLEHGHDQASAVQALLSARGFSQVQTRPDLAGIGRCTGGQWR